MSEIRTLIENRHKGAKECARILNRSVKSVKQCAHRNRISLRRPGCRNGLTLGQPRDVSLTQDDYKTQIMSELRELSLEGKVDLTEIERRMREDDKLQICPHCGMFPIRHKSWGVCDPCHKRYLSEQHRETLASIQAQRDLNRSKQMLKRYREENGIRAPKARG